jgi:predicted secreted protein
MRSSHAIDLRPGEEHRVALAPAASGGYLWSFRVDGDAASVAVDEIEEPRGGDAAAPHPARGESLEQEFVVRAERAGDATVEFEHRRSWEDGPASDTYTLRVHVAG